MFEFIEYKLYLCVMNFFTTRLSDKRRFVDDTEMHLYYLYFIMTCLNLLYIPVLVFDLLIERWMTVMSFTCFSVIVELCMPVSILRSRSSKIYN